MVSLYKLCAFTVVLLQFYSGFINIQSSDFAIHLKSDMLLDVLFDCLFYLGLLYYFQFIYGETVCHWVALS